MFLLDVSFFLRVKPLRKVAFLYCNKKTSIWIFIF